MFSRRRRVLTQLAYYSVIILRAIGFIKYEKRGWPVSSETKFSYDDVRAASSSVYRTRANEHWTELGDSSEVQKTFARDRYFIVKRLWIELLCNTQNTVII